MQQKEDDNAVPKMKFYEKSAPTPQSILKVVFAALFIMLFSYVILKQIPSIIQYLQPTRPNLGYKTQIENQWYPARLEIPSINVDTAIEDVGVTSGGAMGVPSNTYDVGWFDLGPRPGEKGSAVIAGHFDGKNGEVGVFKNLYKLKKGDKLYIKDDKGKTISFAVSKSRLYDPGYAKEVFSISSSAHLNLITCDGVWNGIKKSYSKRLVVFADITH
jgi:LPXTG-site transpeptidase (sortase) family protein